MRCPECNTNWVAGVTHCDLCDIDMEEATARHRKAAKKRSGGGGSVRNRVFGGIGAVWGAGILLNALFSGLPSGGGAVAVGTIAGYLTGAALFAVGLFYLIRG